MRITRLLSPKFIALCVLAFALAACQDIPTAPEVPPPASAKGGIPGPPDGGNAGGGGKENLQPTADAGGPYTVNEGVAVTLDGSGSNDPDGPEPKLTYDWTFGDGDTGIGVQPAHAFVGEGPYTVTLIVTDNKGLASEPATTTVDVVIPIPPPPGTEILVGAGDIADCNSPGDEATAALLDGISGTVFTAGDNAYNDGTVEQFNDCYDPNWGRHKVRTRPSPGNHDYLTAGAGGYFGYFGSAAGDPSEGYYSYDLGAWHVLALNSNISRGPGSPQIQWLNADLAASSATCTVAYFHHARFSSGSHQNDSTQATFWDELYAAGADVVLVGHDHDYERFAPQDPNATADPSNGIRQFVVGTGGRSLRSFGTTRPNSEFRYNADHGVLKLSLYDGGYDWQFISTDGVVHDSGSDTCH